MISVARGTDRVARTVERAFLAYSAEHIDFVSFTQIKDWINSNTKDGISSPRLASVLRKKPQFFMVEKLRRVGSNATQTFWSLGEHESSIQDLDGWVRAKTVDTGI